MVTSQGSERVPAAQAVGPGIVVAAKRRSGIVWGLRSYWLMVRWDVASMRLELPVLLIVQSLLGAGTILGFALFFDEISQQQAAYLATGGTVLIMVVVGVTILPQFVAQMKLMGYYDYLWTLPVPRFAMQMATTTVYALVALPGMILALLVAALRFDIQFDVGVEIIPIAALVLFTSTSLGYALGHVSPSPILTNAITNLLIFVIFLFSAINYPAERLPDWLRVIQEWLPFLPAADAIRGALTDDLGKDMGRSVTVLIGWAVIAWASTYWVMRRRR